MQRHQSFWRRQVCANLGSIDLIKAADAVRDVRVAARHAGHICLHARPLIDR